VSDGAEDRPVAQTADGRYHLYDGLGSGQFGAVFRGRDTWQERAVAIKVLDPEEVTLDAALNEARFQTLCEHPHVVTIHNVVLEPPNALIVMEYLPAGSCEARLQVGQVSYQDALRWTRNALDGLAHAHAQGILHRDLKPANLLILANGEAALSDFGIAEDTVRARVATDKHYPPLIAPEVLGGTATSPGSDVWAMGTLLYRLLTGRFPYPTVDDTLRGGYEAPQRINPQVTRAVTRVIERALAATPEKRYATARQMLADLTRCRADCSWVPDAADTAALESWHTTTGRGYVTARLLPAPRRRVGAVVLEVKLDRGAGARRAHADRLFSTEAQGREALRALLRSVVEGRALS
jgi:eukaryotic-like serine/threonine-protein kinase